MRPDLHDARRRDPRPHGARVKERIERGEDPEAARLAALREFGNVLLTHESMQAVWRPRWLETAGALGQDVRVALRSLRRAKGLAVDRRGDARAGHRRQRRGLQRRPPGAASSRSSIATRTA